MSFFLFIVLNAVLFLRPQELFAGLEWTSFYEWTIIACMLTTGLAILRQLSFDVLLKRPINVCVLGLLIAVPLSHLAQFSGDSIFYARMTLMGPQAFSKTILYFLLASAVLNTDARVEQFFNWILILIGIVAVLSVGCYYNYINIPSIEYLERIVQTEAGEVSVVHQLKGTGIFNDPNDLAMILVFGMVIAIHVLTDPSRGIVRFTALPLLALIVLGIYLTKSRGGMLAFGAAGLVLAYTRWGKWRTLLVALLSSPLIYYVFKMRGGEGATEGTGQQRIQLWSQGFTLLKSNPLFGIGQNQFAEEMGLVAHNSFVHTYVELGIFGGSLFFGAFFAGLLGLYRLREKKVLDFMPKTSQFRLATIAAALVGFAVSMLSLSRAYIIPTYMVFALASASIEFESNHLRDEGLKLRELPATNLTFVKHLVPASIICLAAIYLFARFTVNWG